MAYGAGATFWGEECNNGSFLLLLFSTPSCGAHTTQTCTPMPTPKYFNNRSKRRRRPTWQA
eukprot:5642204-Alexandrium_andersonii.AAC.1